MEVRPWYNGQVDKGVSMISGVSGVKTLDELRRLRNANTQPDSGYTTGTNTGALNQYSSQGAGKVGNSLLNAGLGIATSGLGPAAGVTKSLLSSLLSDKSPEETWDSASNSLINTGVNLATSQLGPASGLARSLLGGYLFDKSPDEMWDSARRSAYSDARFSLLDTRAILRTYRVPSSRERTR